jgi:hypothetical protein
VDCAARPREPSGADGEGVHDVRPLSLVETQTVDGTCVDYGAALDPLIPEGTYQCVYLKHDLIALRMFNGQPKLFVHFRLIDPQHFGTDLYRAYRVRPGRGRNFVTPKRSDLFKTLSRLQPSARPRPDQPYIRSAFHGRVLIVSVRTVKRDMKQMDLPPNLYYSVVHDVLSAETVGPESSEQ